MADLGVLCMLGSQYLLNNMHGAVRVYNGDVEFLCSGDPQSFKDVPKKTDLNRTFLR